MIEAAVHRRVARSSIVELSPPAVLLGNDSNSGLSDWLGGEVSVAWLLGLVDGVGLEVPCGVPIGAANANQHISGTSGLPLVR